MIYNGIAKCITLKVAVIGLQLYTVIITSTSLLLFGVVDVASNNTRYIFNMISSTIRPELEEFNI